MKAWLLKFKISNALSDRKPLPPEVERAINKSEPARRFMENSRALDENLKNQLSLPQAPAFLHESIMHSVSVAQETVVRHGFSKPGWLAYSSIVALVMLICVVAGVRLPSRPDGRVQAAESHSLAAASSALQLGDSVVREAPGDAVAPLYDEANRLDHDVTSAKQFLLASLP